MEKELQSVQAEFELHFDSDSAKSERVNRETCDQSHDSAKFGTGNRKTLKEDPEAQGIDVRERLLEFYSKHYSANVMTLCVLGKDSLDELQAMIIERLPFSEIQNKQIDLKQRCELLEKSRFREAHLQKEIRIVPKKEMCELLIDFHPFEWFESLSVEHKFNLLTAYAYLSNLFNQKHDGSVLAELKDRRGLVEDVMFCPNGIYFRLEKDGISTEKVDEIVATVFQFLHFAKRDGIQRWIHEEMNTIQEIALNNEETVEPLTLISAIAIKMQWFKIEWVVKFAFSDLEFKPALIEQLIDNLKPEHMRLTLISKQFEGKTDRKEKYYGIQYSYETIDQKRVDRWNDVGYNENFVLHKPNEYIAANFELVEREKEEHRDPVLIKQELAFESWFLQDSRFKTPRASYYVQLKNPFLPPDLVAEKTMQLFCQLLRESLKEHSRLAAQAGIFSSIGLANAFAGLVIELSGYSDKLPALLATIMDRLIEFEPDRERFEKLKEEEIRRLKNLPKRPMKTILLSYWQLLSSEYRHSVEETLDCMEQVTFEQLAGVRERFFSQLFVKQFVYGNVTRADADRVESLTKSRLIEVYRTSAALKVSFVIRRLLKLDDNAFYVYHRTSEEHHQNAISSCFQIGPETPANFVKTCLVVRLLKQHFYNELRTEEQLGYSVMMNLYSLFKVQSIAFCIQSSYSVEYLDERVQQFIGWATDHLSKLTDEEFDSHKEGMRTLYAEPIRRLSTQSAKFWGQISSDALQFDRREAILAALEEVSKEDVVGLFNEHLVRNPRKLFIRITGTKKIAGQAIGARAAGLLVNGLSRIGGHLSGGLSSLAEMAGLKVAGGLGGEALEKKPGDESIDVKLDELQLSQNGKLVADNVPKVSLIWILTFRF